MLSATDRIDLANAATLRWSRSCVAGHASRAQWNPVEFGYRSAVARGAEKISVVPDLPSSFPAVGAGGQAGTHLACSGGAVAGPRETPTGGSFRRRLLHGGK